MVARDASVEDTQELGSDIAGHPGIPRRVEPPDLSLPAPSFSLLIVVVERVNVFFLIFQIKRVTACFKGFLVFWFAFIEHILITR